ncbi:hypothetical protein QFZ97_004782 [Paraburkholderia youngii]
MREESTVDCKQPSGVIAPVVRSLCGGVPRRRDQARQNGIAVHVKERIWLRQPRIFCDGFTNRVRSR